MDVVETLDCSTLSDVDQLVNNSARPHHLMDSTAEPPSLDVADTERDVATPCGSGGAPVTADDVIGLESKTGNDDHDEMDSAAADDLVQPQHQPFPLFDGDVDDGRLDATDDYPLPSISSSRGDVYGLDSEAPGPGPQPGVT